MFAEIKKINHCEFYITSKGEVLSSDGILQKTTIKNGYQLVKFSTLEDKVLSVKVHRLVAEAFLPNLHKFKYLIHKNKNKQDNDVTNLYWSTTAYSKDTNLSAKRPLPKPKEIRACLHCKKEFVKTTKRRIFCSMPCGNANKASKAGRASAQKINTRSQNEILFANKCIAYFGAENIVTNKAIFNGWDADVIVLNLKIAILWNGKWHYNQIKIKGHNLKQVQNRDKIKQKEILNLGYTSYVIKDLGKFSQEKVEMEFEKFINSLTGPLASRTMQNE